MPYGAFPMKRETSFGKHFLCNTLEKELSVNATGIRLHTGMHGQKPEVLPKESMPAGTYV